MQDDNFTRSMVFTHRAEGGFVDHPADRGGPTNWGFSLATLRRLGIDVDQDGDTDVQDVRLLKPNQARLLYRLHFWEPIRGDGLPWPICLLAFDAAVHHGVSRAARMLQEAANRQLEDPLLVDGLIGPITLRAVKHAHVGRLGRDLLELRRAFMRAVVAADPGQAVNLRGWLARVDNLEIEAGLTRKE
jgi:lysozyme family protein